MYSSKHESQLVSAHGPRFAKTIDDVSNEPWLLSDLALRRCIFFSYSYSLASGSPTSLTYIFLSPRNRRIMSRYSLLLLACALAVASCFVQTGVPLQKGELQICDRNRAPWFGRRREAARNLQGPCGDAAGGLIRFLAKLMQPLCPLLLAVGRSQRCKRASLCS